MEPYRERLRRQERRANILTVLGVSTFVVAFVAIVWFAIDAHDRFEKRCHAAYGGAVQTQTWSGYGFHTNSAGKMVYGYYSTSTTVCRLVSGPNAGVIVDTE